MTPLLSFSEEAEEAEDVEVGLVAMSLVAPLSSLVEALKRNLNLNHSQIFKASDCCNVGMTPPQSNDI